MIGLHCGRGGEYRRAQATAAGRASGDDGARMMEGHGSGPPGGPRRPGRRRHVRTECATRAVRASGPAGLGPTVQGPGPRCQCTCGRPAAGRLPDKGGLPLLLMTVTRKLVVMITKLVQFRLGAPQARRASESGQHRAPRPRREASRSRATRRGLDGVSIIILVPHPRRAKPATRPSCPSMTATRTARTPCPPGGQHPQARVRHISEPRYTNFV